MKIKLKSAKIPSEVNVKFPVVNFPVGARTETASSRLQLRAGLDVLAVVAAPVDELVVHRELHDLGADAVHEVLGVYCSYGRLPDMAATYMAQV